MSNNSESIKLKNSKYDVLSALGREADFLYSTVDKYIQTPKMTERVTLFYIDGVHRFWNLKENRDK